MSAIHKKFVSPKKALRTIKKNKNGLDLKSLEMKWFGRNYSTHETWGLIIVIIVAIVVFTVIMVQMQKWYYRNGHAYNLTYVTPMPWLTPVIVGILIGLIAYGGYTIFSQSESEMRGICIALWISSLLALLAASTAFFERDLPVEGSYLMMLFIAFHVGITYKFFGKKMDAIYAYIPAAVIAIYLALVMMSYIQIK